MKVARLAEIAVYFLRLGLTAFGGPAAHIAMMEEHVVRRKAWMTREAFLDLLGVANLIPGPSSTELAIFIGYDQAGWAGLVLGGVCFIAPAALLTLAVAWAYVRFGALPQGLAALWGVKPVVVAIIVQALVGLGRTAVKNRFFAGLAALATLAGLLDVNPLLVLAGAGVLAVTARELSLREARHFVGPPTAGLASLGALPATAPVSVALSSLFLVFLKVGAVLFGSGYVLLAFLRADLVERYHWLTESQLLDAVAVGQLTPGPVFTAATFVGYVLRGGPGAAVATLGIFLPSFLLVAFSGPIVSRVRRSPRAGAFLDGVNVASLALMAAVTWQLGRAAVVDVPTAVVALAAGALLLRFRVNSVWLVMGGVVAGMVRLALS